jgi:hypothetical protein
MILLCGYTAVFIPRPTSLCAVCRYESGDALNFSVARYFFSMAHMNAERLPSAVQHAGSQKRSAASVAVSS